jgi:heterodisulfide reductase subunit C
MSKLEDYKKKPKKLEIKSSKELAKAEKAIEKMRKIFKEAGFSPYEEYMKSRQVK